MEPQNQGTVPQITPKQTKAEIYDAYKTVLQQYKQNLKQTTTQQHEQKKEEDRKIVEKSADYSVGKISEHLNEVKQRVIETLETVGQKLQSQATTLSDIEQAIIIKRAELDQIHKINLEANTLTDILLAQEEAKRENEREENSHIHARDLERQEEEAQYEMKLREKRRAFDEEMQKRQTACIDREKAIKEQELELFELRKKAGAFPTQLEEAILEERKLVLAEQAEKAATQEKLNAAQTAGEQKILEFRIMSLQKQYEEEKQANSRLEAQLEAAVQKNQELASKLIEGVSGLHSFKLSSALDDARKQEKKDVI